MAFVNVITVIDVFFDNTSTTTYISTAVSVQLCPLST
jgi:hypothetical protein